MFRSSVPREHGISNRKGHRGSCGFTRRGRRGVDRNFRIGPLTRASYVSPALDEAYLDVSENKTRLPTATQVARTIREQILWLANCYFSSHRACNITSCRRVSAAGVVADFKGIRDG
jgi:hypothetical protein